MAFRTACSHCSQTVTSAGDSACPMEGPLKRAGVRGEFEPNVKGGVPCTQWEESHPAGQAPSCHHVCRRGRARCPDSSDLVKSDDRCPVAIICGFPWCCWLTRTRRGLPRGDPPCVPPVAYMLHPLALCPVLMRSPSCNRAGGAEEGVGRKSKKQLRAPHPEPCRSWDPCRHPLPSTLSSIPSFKR